MTEEVQVKDTVEAPAIQDKIETNITQEKQNKPIEESDQDRNWRVFRENRQKEREQAAKEQQARIAAEKEAAALKAALEAIVNKPSTNSVDISRNQYEDEETEEQRIENKVAAALAKKEAEYERKRQEKEAQEFPQKLEATFKDFSKICSSENLDYLEYHHPELARSLGKMPQGFDKWADIYNAVKRYVPNPDSQKDSMKADKNLQKPQSMSHSTMSQSGSTSTSSMKEIEARRAENWKRMQKQLKGIN